MEVQFYNLLPNPTDSYIDVIFPTTSFPESSLFLEVERGSWERGCISYWKVEDLAPVVRRLDNTIHWINHYPVDKCLKNKPCSPLDSDLSGG